MPEIDPEKFKEFEQVSYVYDENDEQLAMLSGEEKRIYVKYEEIPQQLVNAFLAIEDKRYFEHNGVDTQGVLNALYGEFIQNDGTGRGGSTITQQLIKNTFLTPERSYKRKAQEMVMAIQLEKTFPKTTILEFYLNEIFMGEDNYGVQAAALDYFGKPIAELSLKECAAIAAITASPNYYNPRENYKDCSSRANLVLKEMYLNDMITQTQCNEAINEELVITDDYFDKIAVYGNTAFIDYVIKEVASDLLEGKGMAETPESLKEMEYHVRTGGYRIYTTLDTAKQAEIQQTVSNFKFNADTSECSAVFIDHHTGEIKVMIPGRSENSVIAGFNRATDSLQPIGSAAKPIFVYAPYIEMGANTNTIVDDTRSKIQGYNTEQGYPNGETTGSMISLRYAIETSRNVAAVKTLAYKVGIENAYKYMLQEGINPAHSSQSLNGIALGSDGYTTLEIAGAYACLANDGVYIEPHGYSKVTDLNGKTIIRADNHYKTTRVFSSETAFMITDILQSTVNHGYSSRAQALGIKCGNKTGTHEHNVVTSGGYTHYYTAFVRISRDDYKEITETSLYHAVELWTQTMKVMNRDLPDAPIQDKTAGELKIYYTEDGSICHVKQ